MAPEPPPTEFREDPPAQKEYAIAGNCENRLSFGLVCLKCAAILILEKIETKNRFSVILVNINSTLFSSIESHYFQNENCWKKVATLTGKVYTGKKDIRY